MMQEALLDHNILMNNDWERIYWSRARKRYVIEVITATGLLAVTSPDSIVWTIEANWVREPEIALPNTKEDYWKGAYDAEYERKDVDA